MNQVTLSVIQKIIPSASRSQHFFRKQYISAWLNSFVLCMSLHRHHMFVTLFSKIVKTYVIILDNCRIDENMDDSLSNVEGAQSQLLKYYNSISSNRWLMLKIFMVLITFLLIFVFFIA